MSLKGELSIRRFLQRRIFEEFGKKLIFFSTHNFEFVPTESSIFLLLIGFRSKILLGTEAEKFEFGARARSKPPRRSNFEKSPKIGIGSEISEILTKRRSDICLSVSPGSNILCVNRAEKTNFAHELFYTGSQEGGKSRNVSVTFSPSVTTVLSSPKVKIYLSHCSLRFTCFD